MVKQNAHVVVFFAKGLRDQMVKYTVQIVTTKNGENILGNNKRAHIIMILKFIYTFNFYARILQLDVLKSNHI